MVKSDTIGMKTVVFELLTKHLLKFCTAEIYDQRLDEFIAKILEYIIVTLGTINIVEENIDATVYRFVVEKINEAVLSNVTLAQKLAKDHMNA